MESLASGLFNFDLAEMFADVDPGHPDGSYSAEIEIEVSCDGDLGDPAATIVVPFVVAIDSREQSPFRFTGIDADKSTGGQEGDCLIVPTVVTCLTSGDYSIIGLEDKVAVERKSVSDWFGSISSGRERFEREMERLATFDHAVVVIEGDWSELLLNSAHYTRMSPKTTSRTMLSWAIRYGVHFVPCMNRRHAELVTFQTLSQFHRQWQHKQSEKQKPTIRL